MNTKTQSREVAKLLSPQANIAKGKYRAVNIAEGINIVYPPKTV